MVLLQNTAEGGTSGTTVTVANSGGASGDAFTSVSGSPTYSPTGTPRGLLAYAFAAGSTTVNWIGASGSSHTTRGYFRCAAAATTSSVIVNFRTASGQVAVVFISTAGRVCVQNAAESTVFTSTASIPYNTPVRIELAATVGTSTTNGVIRMSYYLGDSTTPIQSYVSTTANTGTAPLTTVRFGRFSGAFAAPIYFDDVAYADQATFIGPNVPVEPEVHTTAGTATARASATGTTSSVRTSAASVASRASAAATTTTTRASTGAATATAGATSTSTTSRASAGAAASRASASGATTTGRASASTAAARATAVGSTGSTRVSSGTAAAQADAAGQTSSTHTSAGTATSRATASAVTTQEQAEVHVTAGTASSRASASAVTSTERSATGTALSRARAYASTTSVRTGTGAAAATAKATASTVTLRTSLGTATAQGVASASTTTSRVSAGTATARAYATAVTVHGSDLRDITVTWGGLSSRGLTATAQTVGLGARLDRGALAGSAGSGQLKAATRTSTLTVTLED